MITRCTRAAQYIVKRQLSRAQTQGRWCPTRLASRKTFHTRSPNRMPRILDVDIYADIDRPEFLVDGYHGGSAAESKGSRASSGGFTINGAPINGSVMVHSNAVFLWDVTEVQNLSLDSLVVAKTIDPRPELILIGTGESAELPPKDAWIQIKRWANDAGVGVEIMDSPSACSTFNILTQEERRVVAYLIAVQALGRDEQGAVVPLGVERAAPVGRGGRRGVERTIFNEESEPKRLPNMHPDTEWTKVS